MACIRSLLVLVFVFLVSDCCDPHDAGMDLAETPRSTFWQSAQGVATAQQGVATAQKGVDAAQQLVTHYTSRSIDHSISVDERKEAKAELKEADAKLKEAKAELEKAESKMEKGEAGTITDVTTIAAALFFPLPCPARSLVCL